jgi:hypothetical protein
VSPMKYELEFYIPEDDILHSHGRENLYSYNIITTNPFYCTNRRGLTFCREYAVA